jgi:hypothetical protein
MRQKDLIYMDLMRGGSKYAKVYTPPVNQVRKEKISKIKSHIK